MQHFGLQQQLFAAGAAAVQVDGREHALFVQTALQVDFAVAGAFEFFKNHLVHAAAGVDQGGGDDGQAAAFFHIAGRTKETLGALQSIGVHTTREHFARRGHHVVIGAGQAGDRVEQDHHVFFQFHQALGTLDHHFGHMHVARGGFVKRGRNHFAAHAALHLGHFFRALVDQQHHQVHIGVVGGDGVGDLLHHDCLARLGLRHDQGALAAAERGDDVDHTGGDVFFALDVTLQTHLLFGEQRRQVLEHDLVFVVLGQVVVDLVELGQGKVALAVFGDAHFAFDHVAGVQVKAPHLAGADVDVVGAGGVAGIGAAQEAKTVGQDFQHAIGKNLFARFGAFFDDGKHQLLFAHATGVLDFERVGLLQEFGHMECLEFVQMHGIWPVANRSAGDR